jgi:beta-1,2-mannobiose phosphorylase / 1,2-beta-oligomannan phosphorylase
VHAAEGVRPLKGAYTVSVPQQDLGLAPDTRPVVGTRAAPRARRLPENPLIGPADIVPSHPALEVVGAFNAAAIRCGDDIVLLLRVAERPREGVAPGPDACLVSLDDVEPRARPMDASYPPEQLIGFAFLDTGQERPGLRIGYLPRDLPDLGVHDARCLSYRGRAYPTTISHLRVARSRDGVRFMVDSQPALAPEMATEEYGCEDARITEIEGRYYVTYVTPSRLGIATGLASTADFRSFRREGMIFLPDHKDVALFPGRIGGRYWALTRPMPAAFDKVHGIWLASSPDLRHWGEHQPLALPRPGYWDCRRTGGSAVPFYTDAGWLVLYHGVDETNRYCMGGLLLDGDDPRRVLARSPEPILAPEAPFERAGFYGNVVLSCGHVPLDPEARHIRLYYGAADRVTGAADFATDEILASLR